MKKHYLIAFLSFLIVNNIWAQEPIMTFTSTNNASVGIKFYAVEDNTHIQIDWGNGKVDATIKKTGNTVTNTSAGNIAVYADPAKIVRVTISNRYLRTADFTGASGLTILECSSNTGITSITLPEETNNLQTLDVSSNNLTSLDVSKYVNLTKLVFSRNANLTTVTLPAEINHLREITGEYNAALISLDLSTCSELQKFSGRSYTALENFALPEDGNSLTDLSCVEMNLTSLDVSKYVNLKNLDCTFNKLSSINLPADPKAGFSVDCSDNYFYLNDLPEGPFTCYYTPQRVEYTINETYTTSDIIDLSAWYISKKGVGYNYNADGMMPTFTWYEVGNSTPLVEEEIYKTIDGCKFQFTEIPQEQVYCVISHTGYPYLSGAEACKTNAITIEKGIDYKPVMTFTTTANANISIKLYAAEGEIPVRIDWGESKSDEIIPNTGKTMSGISTGLITVYTENPEDIQRVVISNRNLHTADFTPASGLEVIECSSNKNMASILLPEEKGKLKSINLDSNKLSGLDVSAFTELTTLICSRNTTLTTLILPAGENKLEELNCNYNESLTALNLSNCSSLQKLSAHTCSSLEEFILPDNGTSLTHLICVSANLKALDVSKYVNLIELDCSYNQLTSILLPEQPLTGLELTCYYNKMYLNDLPEGPFSLYYTPQLVEYTIEDSYTTDDVIDLSKWYVSKKGAGSYFFPEGVYPTFSWYVEGASEPLEEGVAYLKENGCKFRFIEVPEGAVYCVISSAGYPQLKDDEACKTNLTVITQAPEPNELLVTMFSNGNEPPKFFIKTGAEGGRFGIASSDVLIMEDCGPEGKEISCSGGKISIFGNPAKLIYLDVSGIALTELDAGGCTMLQELNCSNNRLKTFIFPAGEELKILNCGNNQLTSLDISNNNLSELICRNNLFTLATLPEPWYKDKASFIYAPQADYLLTASYVSGETIDLSEIYVEKTGVQPEELSRKHLPVITWYEVGKLTPLVINKDYTVEDGCKFTFIFEGTKEIYATATTEAYPDFEGDNIYKTTSYTLTPPSAVNENSKNMAGVYCESGKIYILPVEACTYTISTVSGKIIDKGEINEITERAVDQGIYLVSVSSAGSKMTYKVVVTF